MVEKTKLEVSKPITVNPDFEWVSARFVPLPSTKRKHRCTMCGSEYSVQKGNFPLSKSHLWQANNGYVTICKWCCKSLLENLTSFYSGNEEHAMKHICFLFGWYYDENASSMTATMVKPDGCRVTLYPGRMTVRQVAERGETELDRIKYESQHVSAFAGGDSDDQEEEQFIVTREMRRRWSTGMKPDEYEFLESEFADWNEKVEIKTKSQEELIKGICLAQLNVRRAQASGSQKAVSDAMKSLTDLMANCNLTPRQASEVANSSSTQLCLGQIIKKIEDEEPIGEPTEEFKDPDGIRKYINTFFFGHLAKALHIKNDAQAAYDEEMAKYTVDPGTVTDVSDVVSNVFSDQDESSSDES